MIFDPSWRTGYILQLLRKWKMLLVFFCIFSVWWPFFNNSWCLWPRNINIHIKKLDVASMKNSGSPLLGFKLQFLIFTFLIYFINFDVILTYVNQFWKCAALLNAGVLFAEIDFGIHRQSIHASWKTCHLGKTGHMKNQGKLGNRDNSPDIKHDRFPHFT